MRALLAAGAALAVGCCINGPTLAQNSGLTRTELQKLDFPGPNFVTQIFLVTVAPQGVIGRHTHPGAEMGYVASGTGALSVDGEAERTVKPGDSWAIPAGKVHALRNTGGEPAQLVVTYVVEKDKPLAAPAP